MTTFVDLGDPENPPTLTLDWQPSTVELPYTVGIQGPPGQDAIVPTVIAATAVSSTTIAHSFLYPPDVRLVAAGQLARVGVEYVDDTHVHLTFPAPFTGTIVLS